MTTNTLDFPVFHSDQGVRADEVRFSQPQVIGDLGKAKDFELAQAASSGNMAAFEEIYKRHHRRVYSICLRMLQNASEAEDLTQDVFIQLYRKIGSFRGDSAFTTWLHRMTVNQVLMHFRKRTVKFEKTTEEGETPDQVVSGTANPDRMRIVDISHSITRSSSSRRVTRMYLFCTTSRDLSTKRSQEYSAARSAHPNRSFIKHV